MQNNLKYALTRLLQYLDEHLYNYKQTNTGFNYLGLTLDWYFDGSVYSVDYLNIEDYFNDKGFLYDECKMLAEQFDNVEEANYCSFIMAILNIIKSTKFDMEHSKLLYEKSVSYLKRQGFVVIDNNNILIIQLDEELGRGSYCKVLNYSNSIVKKELLSEWRHDEKLIKRLKYEFENTKKLSGCPNIITVFEYDEDNSSYLLEKADMDLYDYLHSQVVIPKEKKINIIYDILFGIKYAHDNDILHRDLHPGNILKIGETFVIADFGWSKDISINRSLKSSHTEKNNHAFMDPLAAGDLTKMDRQTDIYSIGKIMEFVYSYDEMSDSFLDFIINKCTVRQKTNRYKQVDEIIQDLNNVIKSENDNNDRSKIIQNIQEGLLNSSEEQFIKKLLSKNELCNFIVKYKLNDFGKIINKMPPLDQVLVLREINQGYAEATGYMGFENYDIFGNIAYYVYTNSMDIEIKQNAKPIIEGCAVYRWKIQDLLNKIDANEI